VIDGGLRPIFRKHLARCRRLCDCGAIAAAAHSVNLASESSAARCSTRCKRMNDAGAVLADAVNWAKKHMIVGPARGSSCGSLVCYLLGITTIDPIPLALPLAHSAIGHRPFLTSA
jgi:hypothetical protein